MKSSKDNYTKKVAVIMSVYKNDNSYFFMRAVDSILEQDYKNIVLFIFVDGPVSSQIEEYLDKIESPLVMIFSSKVSLGLANGLNVLIDKLISLGDFEYIARMDSDDISYKTRITRQVEFLNSNISIDICGTSCREFGASFALEEKHLPTTHQQLLDFSITRCPFIHPSVMFRRRVFETGIRYPTDTALTEDMALWFELLVNGFKFANINEVLLDYRLNENTIKRRKGVDKALSEVKVRLYYMFKLKRISFRSILLILSRVVFHLLPDSIMKYAYKNVR
ncbi:glycosyltransferase [Aeromonas veronii]|uniref:glycosyltransferase n=1 Tax=Aeromonas veronii TaxID=654 RepID=UPI003B9E55D7